MYLLSQIKLFLSHHYLGMCLVLFIQYGGWICTYLHLFEGPFFKDNKCQLALINCLLFSRPCSKHFFHDVSHLIPYDAGYPRFSGRWITWLILGDTSGRVGAGDWLWVGNWTAIWRMGYQMEEKSGNFHLESELSSLVPCSTARHIDVKRCGRPAECHLDPGSAQQITYWLIKYTHIMDRDLFFPKWNY